MLPSLRDELRIVLCPDKVIILGLGKGLRRQVKHRAILPCATAPGAPAWQPAVSALEQWLAGNAVGRAKVAVTLSSHFVRYALLPWSQETTSRSEDETLVRILFEEVYGAVAQNWQFVVADGGYGEPRLAAATDVPLLDAIRQALAKAGLGLASCRPYLMPAFNALLKQSREPSMLFAVAEAGHAVLLSVRDGKLGSVRHVALNGDGGVQLPNLLHRELLLGGMEPGETAVYLHAPGGTFDLQQAEGIAIRAIRLDGNAAFEAIGDVRFEMACAG